MKKLIYLFFAIGLVFMSCEPMDDIHEELEPQNGDTVDGIINISITDTIFTSREDANEVIPQLLEELLPHWGTGAIARVNIELQEPLEGGAPNVTSYTVTDQDYDDMGLNFGNFDSVADIYEFLDFKFPDAEEGDIVTLTYQWYSGQVSTRTTDFLLTDSGWTIDVVFLRSADYTVMGQGFSNFDNAAQAEHKISVFLNELFPYALPGTTKEVVFAIYMGGGQTNYYSMTFERGSDNWQGGFDTTLQFGHNGDFWEPDNTIVYTLSPSDFDLISDALEDQWQDPAWSAGNYNNFDRREGNSNYWSNAMILEAINVVLDNIHPDAEEGQKYLVMYAVYTGSAGTESMSVIKQGGEWVLNE